MTGKSNRHGLFEHQTPAKPQGPVECLGMTAFGVPGAECPVGEK